MNPRTARIMTCASVVSQSGEVLVIYATENSGQVTQIAHYRVALLLDANRYRTLEDAATAGLAQLSSVNRALYGPLRHGVEGGT